MIYIDIKTLVAHTKMVPPRRDEEEEYEYDKHEFDGMDDDDEETTRLELYDDRDDGFFDM